MKILLLALALLATAPASAQVVSLPTGNVATWHTQSASDTYIAIPSAHAIVGVSALSPTPAGVMIMIWDLTAPPASGSLTGSNVPSLCLYSGPAQAPSLFSAIGMANIQPVPVSTGLVVAASVASTGTLADCYTYTPVAAYIEATTQ